MKVEESFIRRSLKHDSWVLSTIELTDGIPLSDVFAEVGSQVLIDSIFISALLIGFGEIKINQSDFFFTLLFRIGESTSSVSSVFFNFSVTTFLVDSPQSGVYGNASIGYRITFSGVIFLVGLLEEMLDKLFNSSWIALIGDCFIGEVSYKLLVLLSVGNIL